MTRRKKLAFTCVTLLAVFSLVEGLLAVAGVDRRGSDGDPFLGFSDQVPLLVERSDGAETTVEIAESKLRWFNQQQFAKQKPRNTIRIFALGGSTTYGRPYADPTSFAGWLRELLPVADPTKNWEVINAGGISYASYRIVRVMEELTSYSPDVFVVYTGHNEFLEERTYRDIKQQSPLFRSVDGLLSHSRVYSAMHRLFFPPEQSLQKVSKTGRRSVQKSEHPSRQLEAEVRTRLDKGVGPDAYERDDQLAAQVEQHFRYNLNRMVQLARQCDAQLVFVTPASNLADCSPFKSQPQLAASSADDSPYARWKNHVDAAEQARQQGAWQQAVEHLQQAIKMDPRDAESHYQLGRCLRKLQRYKEARQAFVTARDEDVCPLRAPTGLVETVREVAQAQGVPLVDFARHVRQRSEHELPGESWFLDHVHPTIEGHRALALSLIEQFEVVQLVVLSPHWNQAAIDQVVRRVESEIDEETHGQALRNLAKVLTWSGKTEEANRAALRADALLDRDDAESLYLAANALLQEQEIDAAIAKLKQALHVDPNYVEALNSLGAAYYQNRQREKAISTWERVLQLDPRFAAVHNNLGSIYQGQRDYRKAALHFRKAIEINPRYANAYNNLAVMYRNQKRYDLALEQLEKAIAIDADFAEAHFNLGTIYRRQGQPDRAMKQFRECLQVDSNYGPAYYQMAVLLEEQRDYPAAIRTFKRALRSHRPPIDAARRLAWLLSTCPDSSLRNGSAAVSLLQNASQSIRRPDAALLQAFAAAYAELGRFDEAVAWQQKAIRSTTDPAQRAALRAQLQTLQNHQPLHGASTLP